MSLLTLMKDLPGDSVSFLARLRLNLMQEMSDEKVDKDDARFRAETIGELEEVLSTGLQIVAGIEKTWALYRRAVLAGMTDAIQEQRDDFLETLEGCRSTNMLAFASKVRAMGFDTPLLGRYEASAVEFERLRLRIASRWKTAEDLEDLVADSIPLPAGKLEAIRRKYPPPQEWYDQEGTHS
jgi:hypothetical protein